MTRAREALRGSLSSLVAPAVLLAAALIVAVGGSGADALGSLRQLSRGPDVPPTPVELVSRDAPVGADIGQLDGQWVASTGAPSQGSAASAGGQVGGDNGPSGAGGDAAPSPSPGSRPASGSPGGSPGQPGTGQGGAPSAGTPGSPPGNPAPSRPNPVGDVLDQTEPVGDNLLKPVKPITDQVLGGLGR